jgi:hypothetical protein
MDSSPLRVINLPESRSPYGLRGWLIVLGLVLLLGSVQLFGRALSTHFSPYGSGVNIASFLAVVCVDVLFLRRKSSFPRCCIFFFFARFALETNGFLASRAGFAPEIFGTTNASSIQFFLSFAGLIPWTLYLLRSQRVRTTFIR